MNNVEKIQCLRKLEIQKAELERKLISINKNIEEQKNSCLHISVDLGYDVHSSTTRDKYRCLICGKGKGEEYFFEPKNIVHAENYLPQYDINDEEQCNNKFEHIQTIALGLLKENPDMSRAELVDKLNTLIQKSILFKESKNSPKLVKTRTSKKLS